MKNLSRHLVLLHLRNGVEASVLLPILTVVEQAAEHQHAHEHQGEQQAKVLQYSQIVRCCLRLDQGSKHFQD